MSEPSRPPGLLEELKRRKTVRAALVYLAAAWAGLEAAELLLPTFGAPDWAMRALVIVAALGLVTTVVLAWAFDFTPEGIRRASAPGAMEGEAAAQVSWFSLRSGVAVLVLVGVSLSIGLWIGGTQAGTSRSAGDGTVSQNLVAVIPFAVRGSPDLAYLGEGIVDLVSAKLDGAGPLNTVDPRLVVAQVAAQKLDPADPDAARRVAESLGAGRYITGNLLEVSGRVTVTAYLNDTLQPEGSPEQGVREGDAEEIFEVLDSLVVDLVAGTLSEDADRLQRLATLTTSSLPAAKEYLQGEQLYRQGRYREAAAAYDQAVALDSTFALAYYRKSIAADWIDAYDVRSSADRALELAGKLAPRERALLEALSLRRSGRGTEAEQAFRALAHDYPSDLEILTQYGEAIFHEAVRRGGSMMEAVSSFRKVAQLEPRNLVAQLHLARLYALYDSVAPLKEIADFFASEAPEGERALEVESMYAFLAGDTARQATALAAFPGKDWYYQFYAAHGVSRFNRDPDAAWAILEARPIDDNYLHALVPGLYVVQGRYEEALAYMEERSAGIDPSWLIFEAFVLTSGALPVPPGRASILVDRLRDADPVALHRSSWVPPYEDLSPAFSGFERDYFLALLLIDLGRLDEARGVLASMEAQPDLPHLGTVRVDAEGSLRAELALVAGDRPAALDMLRAMELEVPHAATVHPLPDFGRVRFLRAELERELGDPEVARAFYVGLDESWSPWDSYHRSLLYRALGEMAEEAGDSGEAVHYYELLMRQWRDPDPAVIPARDEIQERLTRLRSSPGS